MVWKEAEKIDFTGYLSVEEITENYCRFKDLVSRVKRDGISSLMEWLDTTRFSTQPASTRFHGNYDGALVEHSLNVYDCLVDINKKYDLGLADDSMIVTALFHDLCKYSLYTKTTKKFQSKKDKSWYEYTGYETNDKICLGHGEQSAILLQQFVRLSREELLMIRWHMGMFDISDYNRGAYNSACEEFKTVSALHIADMLASKMKEIVVDLTGGK